VKNSEDKSKVPARVHILLARDSAIAVAIRRGPSKSVCTVLWDRANDAFNVGQWMRGRIYERRSDISPDGKHLIYFAMNGHWDSETKGSWTAISKVPFLKAATLYPKGDCWFGGGLFTRNNQYWLNQDSNTVKCDTLNLRLDSTFAPPAYGSECTSVYYVRLQRDGWRLIDRRRFTPSHEATVFEKALAYGWTLRKFAHESSAGRAKGRGCYWDDHELEREGLKEPRFEWEWAEGDASTLFWISRGRLFRGSLSAEGLQDEKLLFDFTPMEFEAIKAPY